MKPVPTTSDGYPKAPLPVVLAASGHDPTGGAGVQADAEAIAAMGCACVSLVTALTAQNTARFVSLYPQPADTLCLQAEILLEDTKVAAIKIGAIGHAATVDVLAKVIERAGRPAVVLDPVIQSSTGGELADTKCQRRLLEILAPYITVITPNHDEVLALAGATDADTAAHVLLERGCRAVLVTGLNSRLYRQDGVPLDYTVPRLPGRYHGSGCTLSAALAAGLAQGHSLPRAIRIAVHYTWECLRTARQQGQGLQCPRRFVGRPAPRLSTGLYAIADADTVPGPSYLEAATEQVLAGGAVAVQYRDKAGPQPALARSLQCLCRQQGACFVINDSLALAHELRADGVHLGSADADPAEARARLGPAALIGVSCYDSLERARAAERAGADYVAFGSFFPSATRRNAPRPPLSLLAEARRAVSLPIVAIGGITVENAPQVLAYGADLVAVIRDLYLHPAPATRASEYARLWIP